MRSFSKIMAVAAMAAFAVMAAAQSEVVTPQSSSRSIAAETFKVHSHLAQAAAVFNGVEKRQSGCPTGSSVCPDGRSCCATGTVCTATGCCDRVAPYSCGNSCCESNTCLPDGSCGCTGGSSACGNTCCKYGCEGTKCACAPGYSTRCTDTACCPTGSICIGGGLCRGASAPDPPKPAPSGGSGSGSGSGSGTGGSGIGLQGTAAGTERTFGAVSAMMAMAAIFVAA